MGRPDGACRRSYCVHSPVGTALRAPVRSAAALR
ncbi:hypothetical protein RHECNPAF_13600110 [Rhizobium etli CNPAF512]|nr:hypothetical protein RHECNPAF_13600110 [Rhizobium etli CNPAF512]